MLAPSNIVIPILQRPSARTERQHPQIAVARTADQISHLGAAQHAAAQVMVALQQRPRNLRVPAMATADRRNRHLTQLLQAARHLRNLDLQPPWTSSTGLANSAPLWQYQSSQAIQFCQGFATAHLLQAPAGRAPIQPRAHFARQLASRQRRFGIDRSLDPRDHFTAKMSAAHHHRGNIATAPPAVSSVFIGQPPVEGNPIFMFNGAALGGMGNSWENVIQSTAT